MRPLSAVKSIALATELATEGRSQNPRTGDLFGSFLGPVEAVGCNDRYARTCRPSPSAVALQDQAEVAELVPEVSCGNRLSVGTPEERLVEEGTQEVEVTGLRLVESRQQPVDRPQR